MVARITQHEKYGPLIVMTIGKGKYEKEFSFGVAKARAILENVDKIREFVEQSDQTKLRT